MGRKAKRRALSVWMNGIRVGTWTRTAQGGQEFDYDPGWLQSPDRRPLSLSLPLRPAGEPYRGERVLNFFDNLLPDNKEIRARMQRRFRVPSADPFALLAEVGRDCVGAIQLLPEGDVPEGVRDIRCEALSDADVEKLLDDTLVAPMGQQDAGDLRISIAGAQEKTALLWHGDAWQRPLGATPTSSHLQVAARQDAAGHRPVHVRRERMAVRANSRRLRHRSGPLRHPPLRESTRSSSSSVSTGASLPTRSGSCVCRRKTSARRPQPRRR